MKDDYYKIIDQKIIELADLMEKNHCFHIQENGEIYMNGADDRCDDEYCLLNKALINWKKYNK